MSAKRLLLRHVLPAASLLLAGCASYHPDPLGEPTAALAPPVAQVLSTEASRINRPWLTPTTIDLSQPLDANAIAAIAVLNNPDLKVQREAAHVGEAQAFAARLLPDPSFNFSGDYHLSGPDPYSNIAAQLLQDIGLLRDGHVVAQASRAQVKQVRLDLAWAEWQTAGAARLQAVNLLALQEQAELAKVSAEAARVQLDASLAAAKRGDMAGDPLTAARTALLDAEDRATSSATALSAARIELNRLLGLPPETVLRLAPEAPAGTTPDAAKLLDIALRQRADLAALRAGYDAQEATVHKAVLDQFPGLQIGMTYARDNAQNKTLGGVVNFTAPIWNRNRGGIAIERATRAQLKADYDARLIQARADIASAVEGIAIARGNAAGIEAQLPALERNAAEAGAAVKRGDMSVATANQIEQVLRDRRLQLSTARQSVAQQFIALELLTGVPHSSWDQQS